MKHAFLVSSALALVLGAGIALAQAPGAGAGAGAGWKRPGQQTGNGSDCTPFSISLLGAASMQVACEPGKAPPVATQQLQLAPSASSPPSSIVVHGQEATVAPDMPASITTEGEGQ